MAYCDRKDSESAGAWFEEAYALIYFVVVICCVVRIIYAVIWNPNGNVDFNKILRFLRNLLKLRAGSNMGTGLYLVNKNQ